MKPLLGGFNPLLQPVPISALELEKHHPGRLHKQNPKVTIVPLRDLAEDRAVSGRYLPRVALHKHEDKGMMGTVVVVT
jgi:hypothetical protein